jgi:hypothetical protein
MAENAQTKWISENWIKILIYFGIAVFVLGIIKIFSQMFNGNGPLPKGLGQLFGAFANVINGITDGCVSQGDCTKPTSKDSCTSMKGCDWQDPTTSGSSGSCINVNGQPPAEKNFFSPSCLLGMGAIFALCGALIFFVIGPLLAVAFRKSNENTKAAAEISGKSEFEVYKETINDTVKEYNNKIEEAETKNLKFNDDQKLLMFKQIAENTRLESVIKAAAGGSSKLSQAEQAAKISEARVVNARDVKAAQEDAIKNKGLTEDQVKEVNDHVNDEE